MNHATKSLEIHYHLPPFHGLINELTKYGIEDISVGKRKRLTPNLSSYQCVIASLSTSGKVLISLVLAPGKEASLFAVLFSPVNFTI